MMMTMMMMIIIFIFDPGEREGRGKGGRRSLFSFWYFPSSNQCWAFIV